MCWVCSCKMVAGLPPFEKDNSPLLKEILQKHLQNTKWIETSDAKIEYALLLPEGDFGVIEMASGEKNEDWEFDKELFDNLKSYFSKEKLSKEELLQLLNVKNPLSPKDNYYRYVWKDEDKIWIANDFRCMEGMVVLRGETDVFSQSTDNLIQK